MSEELKKKPYLTPTEVAEWMMVSPVTVRGWAQKPAMLQAEVTPGLLTAGSAAKKSSASRASGIRLATRGRCAY